MSIVSLHSGIVYVFINTERFYSNISKEKALTQNNKGLRDPIWGFVWGAAGTLLAVIALGATIVALPQAAPVRSAITHTLASATPTAAIPTVAPTPTPTPQVVLINKTMTCTDCLDALINYSLQIRSATINAASGQITLLIGVQNNTASTDTVKFYSIMLQDTQTGMTAYGAGDGFDGFTITSNQLILKQPTIPFAPIAGHQYSLSIQTGDNDFTPIAIKL